MTRFSLISFLALTAGVGGALAAGAGLVDREAYGAQAAVLEKAAIEANATATFERADMNGDGALDIDEYASLSIVTAELSLLNGFFAIDTEAGAQTIDLPVAAPQAMSRLDRAQLDAIARREFYRIAGADSELSSDEFTAVKAQAFDAADRNANGELARAELAAYALGEAKIGLAGA